jgi:hypothetical protein
LTEGWVGSEVRFGSWADAITACGLTYESVRLRQTWSLRKILQSIRRMAARRQEVNYASVSRSSPRLAQAGKAWFGSWSAALKRAGIDPEQVRKHRRWSPARVISAIRALPCPLRMDEMERVDSGLVYAARKHFGSWPDAVQKAGVRYPPAYPPKKWTREHILEVIQTRSRFGLSVKSGDIEENLSGLWEAGRREIGTWPQAVAMAGAKYPERQWSWKWPRERILEVIQRRARARRSLRNGVVRKQERGLVEAAGRSFGSWTAALGAAGIRSEEEKSDNRSRSTPGVGRNESRRLPRPAKRSRRFLRP